MKYALIQNSDNSIVEYKDLPEDFDKSTVAHKFGSTKEYSLLPLDVDETPEFNPQIERVEKEILIMATKVREKKTIVRLSDEDIQKHIDIELTVAIESMATGVNLAIPTIVAIYLLDKAVDTSVLTAEENALLDGFRPLAGIVANKYGQAQAMKANASTITEITFS